MSEATTAPTPEEQPERRTIGQWFRDRLLGTTMVGYIARGTLIPLVFYALVFLFGFWRAWVDPEGSAAFFGYFRALFEVIVAIGSILIIIAIGVLITQIARFVNLLRSEVKPITEDTKAAIHNVRVTSEFVQKNAVEPIIKTQSFVAGLIAFLREISRISSILQRQDEPQSSDENETPNDEG